MCHGAHSPAGAGAAASARERLQPRWIFRWRVQSLEPQAAETAWGSPWAWGGGPLFWGGILLLKSCVTMWRSYGRKCEGHTVSERDRQDLLRDTTASESWIQLQWRHRKRLALAEPSVETLRKADWKLATSGTKWGLLLHLKACNYESCSLPLKLRTWMCFQAKYLGWLRSTSAPNVSMQRCS